MVWKKENEYSEKLPHIIISSIEHPAVMEVVNYLSINSLINVTYLPVYESGIVKIEDVRKAITEETILISIMYANNEIGTIQPIKEIGRMLRELKTKNEKLKTIFHTDACQAGNYLNLDVFRLGVDMMTINSSKVYGPKGIGVLYKKEGVKISPISFGGGQERGLRSGTENVPSAFAFSVALNETIKMREKESERLTALRDKFKEKLSERIPEVEFYGAWGSDRLPNNINCRIPGIPSDETIIRLDEKGFAISHKSACASSEGGEGYVLRALGVPSQSAKENVRITLGRETIWNDLERLIDAIEEIYKKYSRN